MGGRLVGGDDRGACEPGGSDLGDGGGQEETRGRGEMRDGATDLEQARLIDSVPLILMGHGHDREEDLQIEMLCQSSVVSGQLSGDGDRDASDRGRLNEGGGDDQRAPSPDKGCDAQPRAPEPVSKRERRRRQREKARQEFERRRRVIQNEPDVSMGEILRNIRDG